MSIEVTAPIDGRREAVFSAEALEFVAALHRRFEEPGWSSSEPATSDRSGGTWPE